MNRIRVHFGLLLSIIADYSSMFGEDTEEIDIPKAPVKLVASHTAI